MNRIVPFYASEHAFRRYEPIFIQAVAAYPQPISFETADGKRSPSTDQARCRDALSSWRVSRWPTELEKVADLVTDFRVWIHANRVWLGSLTAFHAFISHPPTDLTPFNHYILSDPPRKRRRRFVQALNETDAKRALYSRPFLYGDETHDAESPLPVRIAGVMARVQHQREREEAERLEQERREAELAQVCEIEPAIEEPEPDVPEETTPPEPPVLEAEPIPEEHTVPYIQQLIDDLDAGRVTGRFEYPIELHETIKSLTAGRLNVAAVIQNNQVILF